MNSVIPLFAPRSVGINDQSDKRCLVYRTEMWGSRQKKYDRLVGATLKNGQFAEINPQEPRFEFFQNDADLQAVYFSHPLLKVLFLVDVLGFRPIVMTMQ